MQSLDKIMLDAATELRQGKRLIFQQDNSFKHTTKIKVESSISDI